MEDRMRPRIHPELLPAYDASEGFDFENLAPFVARMNAQELERLPSLQDEQILTEEQSIAVSPDAPPLKLRIYRPSEDSETLRPALLFFHGGGFLFGSVYRQENLCQRYVKHVGCVVVSVEYRLAPQWTAPAPVEDAYAALLWVHENAPSLGVDADRLAIAGLSAGGTIVAALSLLLRDRGGPRLRLQMPLYAELDARLETPSAQEMTSYKVWCYANNRRSWDLYLGETLQKPETLTAYDVPALAKDLSGLPPVFSFVGELDPVRDENIAHWTKLLQAGVPVEAHVFPGAYHCFELSTPTASLSETAYRLSYDALRRAFA